MDHAVPVPVPVPEAVTTSVGTPPQLATGVPWPTPIRAWWTVAGLVVAAFLSLMDRLVLNLLVDPIRADLHISESQFGLVQGASFAVVSSLLAVPLGLAADRVNRSRLLIASITVWSVATALGGLAVSYPEFLAARILVGLGEAALWPVAVSMIADILPSYWRGRAIGLLILAQIFGSGASLQVGGWLLRLSSAGMFADTPLLNSLPGWRIVLVCCGGFGAIGVALLLSVREPVRRGSAAAASESGGLRSFLDHVSRHRALFALIYFGALLVAISGSASGAWAPSVYIRHFHLTPAEVGPRLGLIAIGSGILGASLGGWVSDRLARQRRPDRKLGIAAFALLACLPGGALVWAPTPNFAMALQSLSLVFGPLGSMVTIITLQDFVPARSRGLAMSILTLFTTTLGFSIGPSLVAATTQFVFGDDRMVGYALQAITAPALICGCACFLFARGEARAYLAEHTS
jgi:MFS family permease